MKNKRILITGGAGSIGSELARQLYKNNKIFILDINESSLFDIMSEISVFGRIGDITNKETVHDIFSDFKPQVIFHAAALKHVVMCEKYPTECRRTNINGTEYVANEAKKWECLEKFVFISTDKAVNAQSYMGATKRLSEVFVRNQGKGFIVVRFGNVLGSRGSVIPIWQKQIDTGKKITVTDERARRYSMTIEEACELVITAAEHGTGGEIYILDMGEQVNILELAKRIISESRKPAEIEMIGLRSGEALEEKLMFEEEEKRAVKFGKFWIIK
jgi:FlaA1/EpsC-like NDP-sugar epimerase